MSHPRKNKLPRQPLLWLITCKLEDVRGLLTTLKKILFWNYERNPWQWDVLCAVILVFIFLTPKSWLASGERPRPAEHQRPSVMTVLVRPEVIVNEADKGQIGEQIKALTGRAEVEVVSVGKVGGSDGLRISFEVDIR